MCEMRGIESLWIIMISVLKERHISCHQGKTENNITSKERRNTKREKIQPERR